MPQPLLLDSSILSCVLRPEVADNRPVAAAILRVLEDPRYELFVPEIIDYELRRKLLHIGHHRHQARRWAKDALTLLDELVSAGYLPLTTSTMRMAATLWAQTRAKGELRGPEESLDVDVILAAQARQVGGYVVTANEKHFKHLVRVFDWRAYRHDTPEMPE